jgi:arsenate reductase-like glutaredoxin family protein
MFDETSEAELPALIIEHASMIKRPILEKKGKVVAVGFDAATYQSL